MYIINELTQNYESDLISFHVPGHKNGKVYNKLGYKEILDKIYNLDSTEIIGTDNLHCPEGIIKKSQEKASNIFNSDNTYFLVNGSTCGIYASIMSVCGENDKLIVNRDCHKSVINISTLYGINLVYVKTNTLNNLSTVVCVDDFIEKINENLDAKAVFLTYPTYYGTTYNIKKIIDYAHSKNMVVIVDEAHGTHLELSNDLPKSSIKLGADLIIQSTHKTLPSFTQSSMLHTKGNRINKEKLESYLSTFQSSSPSYILMSSLEIAVDIYEKYGKNLMNELLNNISFFKEELKSFDRIKITNNFDKTKIFISVDYIKGYDLEEKLRYKYNIQVELSNYKGVLLVCSIGNNKKDFIHLKNSLIDIVNSNQQNVNLSDEIDYKKIILQNNIPNQKISHKQAFYSDKKSVKIENSLGKICGEYVVPYPPGISIISPGEIINEEIINKIIFYRENNLNITGMKDSKLEFIQIVDI